MVVLHQQLSALLQPLLLVLVLVLFRTLGGCRSLAKVALLILPDSLSSRTRGDIFDRRQVGMKRGLVPDSNASVGLKFPIRCSGPRNDPGPASQYWV